MTTHTSSGQQAVESQNAMPSPPARSSAVADPTREEVERTIAGLTHGQEKKQARCQGGRGLFPLPEGQQGMTGQDDGKHGGGGTVIDLSRIRALKQGEDAQFLYCPLCAEAGIETSDFAAVCRFNRRGAFIAALLCTRHDPPLEIPVVNGEVLDSER